MIDLFPTLVYWEKDIASHLQERLVTSITKLYNDKAYYLDGQPIKGRQWRKLGGVYDSEGNHSVDKGLDSMDGVDGWLELKEIVHQHAITYFKELTDYKWIDQLEETWPVQAWYSVFDEQDNYPWHHHAQYCLIGTYYVQHEEEHSPVALRAPLNSLITNTIPGTSKVPGEHVLEPKTGDLMIWPGWLEHEVPGADSYIYKKDDSTGRNKSYPDPDNDKYEKLRISITMCFLKPDIMLGYKNEYKKQR